MPNSVNGASQTRVVDTGGHSLSIDSAGSIATFPVGPAGAKFYTYAVAEVAGTVAANTYFSLFNPSGNTKALIIYQLNIDAYATAAASTTNNMLAFRTSAHSGGTLVAANAVNKFVTSDPDSTAEVRVGNPTITTVGQTLIGFPPAITAAATGIGAAAAAVPSGASFVCAPGQGLAFRVAAGNTGQLWNVNLTWAEL